MFLLVPAYPGSPGQKAVKQLCACVCVCMFYRFVSLSVCLFVCLPLGLDMLMREMTLIRLNVVLQLR